MPTSEISADDIGSVVTFEVYPTSVLGTGTFNRVILLGITDAESAFQHIDPVSMHKNVYPTLPHGTPDDYRSYNYLKVKFVDSGEVTYVGVPWIDVSTYDVVETTTLTVTIHNTNVNRISDIRTSLLAINVTEFTIEEVL